MYKYIVTIGKTLVLVWWLFRFCTLLFGRQEGTAVLLRVLCRFVQGRLQFVLLWFRPIGAWFVPSLRGVPTRIKLKQETKKRKTKKEEKQDNSGILGPKIKLSSAIEAVGNLEPPPIPGFLVHP